MISDRRKVPSAQTPAIAVVGAGAVGCYFGGMLARSGASVTLIGRPQHVEAIARDGLVIERANGSEKIPIQASTDLSAAQHSNIVLFSVKTVDTETAAQALSPHLAPASTVISLQNGVDNVDRIYAVSKIETIPAVVYVACAMVAPGRVRHSGRGDLIIGHPTRHNAADSQPLPLSPEAIAALFERSGVPCRVSPAIDKDLWNKMVLNCAYNAISALGGARYGRMLNSQEIRELMKQVIHEAVMVARSGGVPLEESELIEAAFQLGEAMSAATSSTAQDLNNGRPTEIDSLNGLIARRAAALGIPAPVNQTLYRLVKLREETSKN